MESTASESGRWWRIPSDQDGSARVAFRLTLLISLCVAVFAPRAIEPKLGLLVLFPFCLGLLAALFYTRREAHGLKACVQVSLRAVWSLYRLLIVLCVVTLPLLAMYIFAAVPYVLIRYSLAGAPFLVGLACAGGAAGYLIQLSRWLRPKGSSAL